VELPEQPVLAPQALQALAVSVQQVQQALVLPELRALQELAPQALQVRLAFKEQRVLVLQAQRGCKAPLVLTERQALPVLVLTVQQGYRVQQVLQVQLAPLVSGQPACRVPLEL
tara:strand:+ start:552 stop:893 length:342 start_codon:yes stop_codon:yes gene_type:complete